MSESNGQTLSVQMHTFQFHGAGRVLTVLIQDLYMDLDELRDDVKPREGEPEIDNRLFLERFRNIVGSNYKFDGGEMAQLTLGETDLLIRWIDVEYAKKNGALRDELRSALRLPATTQGPTPAP